MNGFGGRIGNRVRIPDGTAAVCAEAALVDESRSLGNWEGRACAAGVNSISVSQKTCYEIILSAFQREGFLYVEIRLLQPEVVIAVFIFFDPN